MKARELEAAAHCRAIVTAHADLQTALGVALLELRRLRAQVAVSALTFAAMNDVGRTASAIAANVVRLQDLFSQPKDPPEDWRAVLRQAP